MMSANMRNQNMESWNRYETLCNAMSESEFPSLSESSTDKQKKTKRNVIKLVIPLKTYKEELSDKYREARHATENLKTRMCNSLEKNETCLHGEECRFAHSLEELVTRDCHFKNKCRFVRIKSGKLVNDGDKICRNKHPQESQDDFITRTGLSYLNTEKPNADFACDRQTNYKCANEIKSSIKPPSEPTVIEPIFKFGSSPFIVLPSAYSSSSMKFEGLRTPNTNPHVPQTFKFGDTTSPIEKEIVLRVPKVLAIQALELAMNSGNRCIRVEVVE